MRSLVAIEFLSLDGVMQSLGSPEEDTDGGFIHGGWAAPYGDAVLGEWAADGMATTDAYLFGRRTYEKMAAFWPTQPDDNPMAAHLNRSPKYVASRSRPTLDWAGATLLDGEAADTVRALKGGPGGTICILGSGILVRSLLDEGLIDELHLFVHPLVIGSGKGLFGESADMRPLRLLDTRTTTTGVILARYATDAAAPG
ncbi:MAG TPA: dihydrofolate reductase family protein [Candidatus Limnocylindrales bacterium]|jgi:dihydrofolate reductase